MEIFKKKSVVLKIVIAVVFVILFNFCSQTVSLGFDDALAALGGTLLSPLVALLISIGDGVIYIIQLIVFGMSESTVKVSTEFSDGWEFWSKIAIVALGIVGLVTGGLVFGVIGVVGGLYLSSIIEEAFLPPTFYLPLYAISPEEIFSGDLLVFDINFFNPKQIYVALSPAGGDTDDITERKTVDDWEEITGNGGGGDLQTSYYYYLDSSGEEVKTSKQSASATLSQLISKWYYTIRNVAIVVLMVILVYVGIRMLLSSVASEKSKYKKILGDWVIAMCLVFVLHYIMIFAVNLNENIISIMKAVTEKNLYVHTIELDDSTKSDNLVNALNDAGMTDWFVDSSGASTDADNAAMIIIPTNLIGQTRLRAQQLNGTTEYIGYALAYIVLVFYTIFFTFTYLKRVLMMAFLTVIAPFVAVTYPIDKISDGQAQAFNKWLKEYIFNLLIQPVHLLLYALLISMAFDLAGQNIIYSLVAIGFMIPAEKFVRSLFGFDKASTPGFLEGAAGAALVMSGMKAISDFGKQHLPSNNNPKGLNGNNQGNNEDPNNLYNRSPNSGNGFESLLGNSGLGDNNPNNNSGGGSNFINPPGEDNQEDNGDNIGDTLINPPGQENSPMDESLQDDPLDRPLDEELPDMVHADYTALGEQAFDETDGQNLFNLGNESDYEDTIGYADFETTGENEVYMMPDMDTENESEAVGRRINTSRAIRGGTQQNPADARRARLNELKNDKSNKGWRRRMVAQNLKKTMTNPKTYTVALATAIRGATKVAGAATGAAIGAAAGIASGDIGNVAQNATIGGTSGYALSGAAANLVANPIENYPDARKKAKIAKE